MSFATVLSILGWGASAFAAIMVVPALFALGYGETGLASTFLVSAGLTFFTGGALVIATRGAAAAVSKREGFLVAVLAWAAYGFFGALPFFFSGYAGSVVNAYFESLSGLTTTGATIFADVESLPFSILIWRALLQWVGGLGTIMLALALLTSAGVGGMHMFSSRMPWRERADLQRRLRQAAISMSWVYAVLTVACAASLWAVGMPPFDALSHALTTLSTGGFSTRNAGIAAFDSLLIEIVLMLFMIAAATNFTLHWASLYGRAPRYHRDVESRYFVAVLAVGAALAFASLILLDDQSFGDSLRVGIFSAVSVLTTTGFSAAEGSAVAGWPIVLPVILIALMLIGGSAGSTAGGIKLMRLIIIFKLAGRELARLSHPHGVVRMRYGRRPVDEETLRSVWGFLTIFMTAFAAISIALSLLGVDLQTAVSATAATLSNTGAALPMIDDGSAYGEFSAGAKWVLSLSMILGRLELVTILVLLTPAFWRN